MCLLLVIAEETTKKEFVEFGYKLYLKTCECDDVSKNLNRQFITRTNIKGQTEDEINFQYVKIKQILYTYTLSF